MGEQVCFEPFIQKDVNDCALACLSIYLGVPYATVRAAMPKRWNLAKMNEGGGLTIKQMLQLARRLGHPLRLLDDFDSDDCGIIDLDHEASGCGHVALFLKGVVYTTATGMVWTDLHAYVKHHGFTLVGLITRKDV